MMILYVIFVKVSLRLRQYGSTFVINNFSIISSYVHSHGPNGLLSFYEHIEANHCHLHHSYLQKRVISYH